jgi:hypothetical protein
MEVEEVVDKEGEEVVMVEAEEEKNDLKNVVVEEEMEVEVEEEKKDEEKVVTEEVVDT